MSYETEFMKEFEEWIKTQVMINEMALEESKKVFDEDQDERAKICLLYTSSLTARATTRAGTKVGLSDPVVPHGRAIAQRIRCV